MASADRDRRRGRADFDEVQREDRGPHAGPRACRSSPRRRSSRACSRSSRPRQRRGAVPPRRAARPARPPPRPAADDHQPPAEQPARVVEAAAEPGSDPAPEAQPGPRNAGRVQSHPLKLISHKRKSSVDARFRGDDSRSGGYGRTTRSSRWIDLVGHAVGEVARVQAGDRGGGGRRRRHHPRANTCRRGRAPRPCRPRRTSPRHVDHAGREQAGRALDQRPAGAGVDDDRAGDPAAKAIHSLRGRRRRSRASKRVPTGSPRTAPGSTPVALGVGDHGRHARPRGDAGRRELARHAAAPPAAAADVGA